MNERQLGALWARFGSQLAPDNGLGSGGSGGGSGDGGSTGGDGGSGSAGGSKITFTPEQQAAMDAIIAERVSRASKSAGKTALEARAKELGFDTIEAMETALKAHRDAQEKEKTDLQKAQEAKAAAEAQAKAAAERAKTALIRAAFAEQAIAQNLASAEDAFRLADLSKVTVSDDGTVEGVKEAVEVLVETKPYLVKQGGSTGSGGTGGNPGRDGGGNVDKSAEQGRQLAMQRNQQSTGGFDPWRQGEAVGPDQTTQIAQAVAAAVTAVIGNKQ